MPQAKYELPELPFGHAALEPHMSQEQLTVHYTKHHNAYADKANTLLDNWEVAKQKGQDMDIKAFAKAFAFQVGGYVLHSLFWKNLSPAGQASKPEGELKQALEKDFGSIDGFKSDFKKMAMGVEGSGWAALVYCRETGKLLPMQIEKHNVNLYPTFSIVMLLDMFEHAYYIDYQNDKSGYIDAFWHIVNWQEVLHRFRQAK